MDVLYFLSLSRTFSVYCHWQRMAVKVRNWQFSYDSFVYLYIYILYFLSGVAVVVYHRCCCCCCCCGRFQDVAARGLDLPRVDWIVQYNAPVTAEDYVHRVGRTARVGNCGQALIFLAPSESQFVNRLANRGIR